MRKLLNLLPLCLLASCSLELAETGPNTLNEGVNDNVVIHSKPFMYDDDTRTALTATDKAITFSWADGDAIGVFPISPSTNSQAKQVLHVSNDKAKDARYATFDGAGWELKDGNTYAAYFPYNGELPSSTSYNDVQIDLNWQDGTLETIGKKYDYMYAPSSGKMEKFTDGTHQVLFDFEHAVSILQLKLTMPVAAKWKEISLTSASGRLIWTMSAYMNVATGETKNITTSSTISLGLNGVVTKKENEEITLYVSVLPTTTGILSLNATTSDGKDYCATLKSKGLKAGRAYRYTAKLEESFVKRGYLNGHEYVDLGLPSKLKWATMNVGAKTPAAAGNLYAWGETNTQNWSTSYEWTTYKWGYNDFYGNNLTKYKVSSRGELIDRAILEASDDAATKNWGEGWRMPTTSEQMELFNNSYCVWTSNYDNGGRGYIVYKPLNKEDIGVTIHSGEEPSSAYSLAVPHIFLPCTSYKGTSSLVNLRPTIESGFYWSSVLYVIEHNKAWLQYFSPDYFGELTDYRSMGACVRAVCE